MQMRNTWLLGFGFSAIATLFVAHAGPPLICHPYAIGDATSLPWTEGSNWDGQSKAYDPTNLAKDTLVILDRATPVLVRMETMRRAVIYGVRDHEAARALREKLKTRADAAEKSSQPNALAYFDYGYFLASLKQLEWMYKQDLSAGIDGYEFVKRALAIEPDSPEMHFAAAIITSSPPRPSEREEHLRKARAARSDGLLARNLHTHFQ
jgi:hypothetical protein